MRIVIGSAAGAFLLTVFTVLFHWIFFRSAFEDGQYFFVFFLTVPVGAVLGAMSSVISDFYSQGRLGAAVFVALGGGGFSTFLFLFLGLFVFCGTENPTILERLGATVFYFTLPIFWSVCLLCLGALISADV